jgi:hypothetical protein
MGVAENGPAAGVAEIAAIKLRQFCRSRYSEALA